MWLVVGCGDIYFERLKVVYYDVILGALGIALTLTAAFDFKKVHKYARNIASGVLDENAIVSYSEMIEHSFYQILNLVQIIFLHCQYFPLSLESRIALAVLATSPWLFRSWFPVNKFSDNYTSGMPVTFTAFLYRIKKYQYMFYKHCLLHGLNVSVALNGNYIASESSFRLYWLSLNAACKFCCEGRKKKF